MRTYTKWFILNCVLSTGVFFMWDWATLVAKTDSSYLSVIIAVLYVGAAKLAGDLAKEVDDGVSNKVLFCKKLDIIRFVAEHATVLGLLSTLLGMCVMLYNSTGSGQTDVQTIINQLKSGASIAFYPSIVGIVASTLLNLQILLLESGQK